MKIGKISAYIRKNIIPVAAAVTFAFPAKIAKEYHKFDVKPDIFKKEITFVSNELTSKVIDGLKVVADTNFRGGITHKFDDNSVKLLKQRIMRDSSQISYDFPIDNKKNIYLEPFGMFFAKRPNGKATRPHLGLDIFVTPMSKKPKTPILVKSPVDGVVIGHKKAREQDNVISNCVTILGVDGRRYSFDHLARPTDFNDSVPLPTVGTIMKAGDSIGYVGRTGETSLWHLHFSVMTDEMKLKQSSDSNWLNLAKKTPYVPLKGQVNPLSREDAGPIAVLINQYRH